MKYSERVVSVREFPEDLFGTKAPTRELNGKPVEIHESQRGVCSMFIVMHSTQPRGDDPLAAKREYELRERVMYALDRLTDIHEGKELLEAGEAITLLYRAVGKPSYVDGGRLVQGEWASSTAKIRMDVIDWCRARLELVELGAADKLLYDVWKFKKPEDAMPKEEASLLSRLEGIEKGRAEVKAAPVTEAVPE